MSWLSTEVEIQHGAKGFALDAASTSNMLASDSTLPLAGLPESTPLKAVAVGLELLLDRAQLWESTAARHVSLAAQLEPAEQLARRWRRLELQSWRRLLYNVAHAHAAGVLHLVPNSVSLCRSWRYHACNKCKS